MTMAKLRVDSDYLALLAETNLEPRQIVELIRAGHKRRGRPANAEFQYRRLESWWRPFHRLNKGLPIDQVRAKFWRVRGKDIQKLLGLKRETDPSRRMAILRGKMEADRVRSHRATEWQIVPAGLDQAVHGRQHRMVTDSNEAVLIRGYVRRIYFGK